MPAYQQIELLPDFPAIQQIQSALWRKGANRGAAVLVGAGFSRNAVLPSPNSVKPPLWTDFCRVMASRLYPNGKAPSDALRLAEEYKAALGPAALESLIVDLVRDGEWAPGQLHSRLVSLPWSDILTTNWDTLLERAAETTDQQTFETVRTVTDIAHARSPRIVKLHGSLPSNRPFIFTEEDYRTYPRQFAPFVNLVQQIFLENELCLIGFSGDDPNFLQWSGWVRDELGAAARRIYLVGVLKLSPSRRKLLEARFVSPVDLAPLVEGEVGQEKHSKASALFLDFLHNSKPTAASKWLLDASASLSQQLISMFPFASPRGEIGNLSATFKELAAVWRMEREAYPGWLVCPASDRDRIRLESSHVEFALRRAGEQLDAQVIYETCWRLDVAFLTPSPWLRSLMGQAVETSASSLNPRQRCEIAVILLRAAREECDRPSFDHWIEFLRKPGSSDEDLHATSAYESALWARDHLDFDSLATQAKDVKGDDPAWKIKVASLYYGLGEPEAATALVLDALRRSRARYFRDRRSIWNISRLAWALFLLRAISSHSRSLRDIAEPIITSSEWPDYVTTNKCFPWDELDALDRKVNEAFRVKTEAERKESRLFDPGSYKSSVATFSESLASARYETARLADAVGLPAEIPTEGFTVDVMRSRLSQTLELSESNEKKDLLRAIRVLGGPSDKLLEKTFGRIEVATIPRSTAEAVIDVLWRAIEFGRVHFVSSGANASCSFGNFWIERLSLYVEVLSRLVVRLTGERAVATFRQATSLVGGVEWKGQFRLFDSFENLLDRSLSAVFPPDRGSLLFEIVNLPLPDERGIKERSQVKGASPLHEWPELMSHLPRIVGRSSDQAAFASRIAVLVSKVRTGDGFTRERATIRLAYLYRVGTLTGDEARSFGEAFWSVPEFQSDVFRQIGIRPQVLFDLPGTNKPELTKLFRSTVLDQAWTGLSVECLGAIVDATAIKSDGSRVFALTPDEATRLFDLAMAWHPAVLGVIAFNESKMKNLLGRALADAVLPFIKLETFGSERIERLLTKNETGRVAGYVVVSLPHIVRLDRAQEKRVVEQILKAVFSRKAETVVPGLAAIQLWHLLSRSGALDKVPQPLKQAVITIVVAARDPWLSSALRLAGEFAEDQDLDEEDKRELTNALDRLWGETSYGVWDTRDLRTVTITLVRAECVRLAQRLKNAGMKDEAISRWIDSTKDDPVPEVRYALSESGV